MKFLSERKNLTFYELENSDLMREALLLKAEGFLQFIPDNKYCFLKVDNDYIHNLFFLLHECNSEKPNYFGEGKVGAHITVFYPEENTVLDLSDIGVKHSFKPVGLFKVLFNLNEYIVLKIASPSLVSLRQKYNLPEELNYKGYNIWLHLTIAKKSK